MQRSTHFILSRQAMAVLRVSAMNANLSNMHQSSAALPKCVNMMLGILERFLEDWSYGLVVRDCFHDVFHVGLSKQRRNEGKERNRCSEEALYLSLITLSLDVLYSQGRIMGKRKEKSSSEFTSLMRPFLTLSQSILIMLCPRSTGAAASATIGSDGVLEIIYSRLLGMTLATCK